jgi:hypothetical protein
MNNSNFLSIEQVGRRAPSVLANSAYSGTSSRYNFVSTADMLVLLAEHGLMPVSARQQNVRTADRTNFCKHVVRLRHMDSGAMMQNVGDVLPEVVITNAHDGTSSWRIQSGLFRLVCSNGLVVSMFDRHSQRVPHREKWADDVLEGVYTVLDDMPAVAAQVQEWQQLLLSPPQQEWFGDQALKIRYPQGNAPVNARQITSFRRWADEAPTLWNIFNRTQENIMRGGLYGQNAEGRRHTTRAVRGIQSDLDYNTKLWDLAADTARILQ